MLRTSGAITIDDLNGNIPDVPAELPQVANNVEDINSFRKLWNDILQLAHDAAESISSAISHFFAAIGNGIAAMATATWAGIVWFANNVLMRIGESGVNILGYLFEKILFGSAGLRPYFQHGLIATEFPQSWRAYVQANTG
jgi:hypothetical protein